MHVIKNFSCPEIVSKIRANTYILHVLILCVRKILGFFLYECVVFDLCHVLSVCVCEGGCMSKEQKSKKKINLKYCNFIKKTIGDDLYSQSRNDLRNKSNNESGFGSAITSGLMSFTQSIAGGITGVVSNPSRGLREDGAWGFMKGVGTGILGAFTKPISGALDLVAHTSRGIAQTTGPRTKKIERRYCLKYNPQLINIYCDIKFKLLCQKRNEYYLLHVPIIVVKRVIKKKETRFKSFVFFGILNFKLYFVAIFVHLFFVCVS